MSSNETYDLGYFGELSEWRKLANTFLRNLIIAFIFSKNFKSSFLLLFMFINSLSNFTAIFHHKRIKEFTLEFVLKKKQPAPSSRVASQSMHYNL